MRSRLLPGERVVRRRGSLQQGQALETLGHAVEYLVDSRMFLVEVGAGEQNQDQEAIQILMRLSRAVFLECPEVVPIRRRMGRWVSSGMSRMLRQGA